MASAINVSDVSSESGEIGKCGLQPVCELASHKFIATTTANC